MTLRVVQWTTGNVGKQTVAAIAANPGFELVGCYAWSPEKVGRDVGELCGLARLGVTATDDVGALLALRPDCVMYNPMWPSIDELVRILGAGVNVVTTAAFINGRRLGPDRKRLVDACERGGSSLFGTGISPGWAELLGLVVAGISTRIDKITISEAAHTTLYDSPETEKPAGFGRPIDDPNLEKMTAEGTAVFGEAVAMMADALGVELDEIVCQAEHAKTPVDLDLGSWKIEAGCVAGVAASWQGKLGDRTIVELNVRWKKAAVLEPDWKIADGYVLEVQGLPTVRTTLQFLPPLDFLSQLKKPADFMVLGHIMTAAPAVNAIPAVVAAPPGIVTYTDVRLPLPRGLVRL
jgi:2,4-diaminopentanoate dehydrogenase